MKIVLAQQNYHIGHFEYNTKRIIEGIRRAKELGADLGGQRKAVLTAFRNGMADKINDVRLASILSLGELGREIIGPDYEVVRDDLKRATRSPQRAISDAATNILKRLADQQEK